jgi:hypothetical protein
MNVTVQVGALLQPKSLLVASSSDGSCRRCNTGEPDHEPGHSHSSDTCESEAFSPLLTCHVARTH